MAQRGTVGITKAHGPFCLRGRGGSKSYFIVIVTRKDVKAYELGTEFGQTTVRRQIAQEALARYGLHYANIQPIRPGDDTAYSLDFSHHDAVPAHPYLGRLDKQQLVLRVLDPSETGDAAIYAELVWVAALLRDTDLTLPEPVPANDGSLVTDVSLDGMAEPHRCVLLR
jgi:hypothetical protein